MNLLEEEFDSTVLDISLMLQTVSSAFRIV